MKKAVRVIHENRAERSADQSITSVFPRSPCETGCEFRRRKTSGEFRNARQSKHSGEIRRAKGGRESDRT